MGGKERKVVVALTLVMDYDVLFGAITAAGWKGDRWSPALEVAKLVDKLPGIHDVISVTNLTMQNTGKDWEEDPIPGDAVDE